MAEDEFDQPEEPEHDPNRFKFSRPDFDAERILAIAARVIAVIIILVLLVLAGRWVHHRYFVKNNGNGNAPAAPASPTSPQASANKKTSSSSSSSNSTTSKTSSKNSQLANTGPGNTLVIFASASILAAGSHLLVTARRQSSKR